ncbi:hypothetical protein Hanom_Chr01g00029441 [Helianthus anomalus]
MNIERRADQSDYHPIGLPLNPVMIQTSTLKQFSTCSMHKDCHPIGGSSCHTPKYQSWHDWTGIFIAQQKQKAKTSKQ